MHRLVLIAHNLRSAHNVGSLLRTAESLGVEHVYLTGYTPYPRLADDTRLPHLALKLDAQIHKTALGAERLLSITHSGSVEEVIAKLRQQQYLISALEQTPTAEPLPTWSAPQNIALIVGREVEGIEASVLALADVTLEIPMLGQKESLNVVQAAAMALYHIQFVALPANKK